MSEAPLDLDGLLGHLRDGSLDAAGWDRLCEMIRTDRAARRRYIASTMLTADLRDRFAENPVALDDEAQRRITDRVITDAGYVAPVYRITRWAMAIAAALLLASAAMAAYVWLMSDDLAADSAGQDGPVVGVLVESGDLRWDSVPIGVGDDVRSGTMRLASGFAMIDTRGGATLRVEGPAVFAMGSASHGRLDRGRLLIDVPPGQSGLTIETPGLRIVDLGTVFDVDVDDDGRTTVRVNEGRVAVTHVASDRTVEIAANHLLRIDPAVGIVNAPIEGIGLLDRNLVINGDFEDGSAVPIDSKTVDNLAIVGWNDTVAATVLDYGFQVDNGYPNPAEDVVPTDRGRRYFVGAESGVITQMIDVSGLAIVIDSDRVTGELSAWLGGFAGQGDAASVTATFIDASGAELSSVTVGPVTPAHRRDEIGVRPDGAPMTGFIRREHASAIPSGTRSIRIALASVLDAGLADAYADNVAFTLELDRPESATPPATNDIHDEP